METYTGVLFNEDLNSGLVQSQFLKPLLKLKEHGHDVKVLYFCKPGTRLDEGIEVNVTRLPVAIPYSLFLYGMLSLVILPILSIFYFIVFSIICKENNNYIVRGYYPSFIFSCLNRFSNGYKFIFDPRSLFIDESMVTGKIHKSGMSLRLWRAMEKHILMYSKATICVSSKQQYFYETICRGKYLLIPCYSELYLKCYDKTPEEYNHFKSCNDKILVGYFGSLDSGWNNKNNYIDFIELNNPNIHYIIISQNYQSLIQDPRFDRSNVTLIPELSMASKLSILSQCDYGLFLMSKNPDWETRLGVKFADYISLGLPVILSPYVGEAVRYVHKYQLPNSIVLPENNLIAIDALRKKNNEVTIDNKEIGRNLFSYDNFLEVVNIFDKRNTC